MEATGKQKNSDIQDQGNYINLPVYCFCYCCEVNNLDLY